MTADKRVFIIAGPNGAGKSTFAREYLPKEAQCPVFVDADLIAAGLSPFDPARVAIRAGRLMLQEIDRHVAERIGFAFETTLSGLAYAQRIPLWQGVGYRVKLIFLSLPDVETAIVRVAARAAQGGHGVPEEVIRRRYARGWAYFNKVYKALVDTWMLYDNSGPTPELLEEWERS